MTVFLLVELIDDQGGVAGSAVAPIRVELRNHDLVLIAEPTVRAQRKMTIVAQRVTIDKEEVEVKRLEPVFLRPMDDYRVTWIARVRTSKTKYTEKTWNDPH